MLEVVQIYLESLWLCLPFSKLELYFGVPILTAQAFKEESKKAGDFFFCQMAPTLGPLAPPAVK